MKQNQKGFGAVEGVLIVVLVLAIAFGGWYVWKQQPVADNGAKKNATAQKQANSTNKPEPQVPDPAADWITYTNTDGKFSFKHPKSWVFAERPEACAKGLVLFAANKAALGACASEGAGQMAVYSASGDIRSTYKLSSGYTDVTETTVTADGVSGTKQVGTAQDQGEGPGTIPNGTKVVHYTFYTNGRTYEATYTQRPTYPDALGDFDYLVTKTLSFNK